ncbi:MAG: hypothetical protein F6K65_36825 [Moorea sp. SIO3C2]|nr:hypothetical protein [Moorena sp. SIO3C2]
MPILRLRHRPDACSTVEAQARCLFYGCGTGQMPILRLRKQARCLFYTGETGILPVLRLRHRQDAGSTLGTQARCLFYGCLPIPDSRFPIPDSRFPIPCFLFPVPCSLFPLRYVAHHHPNHY